MEVTLVGRSLAVFAVAALLVLFKSPAQPVRAQVGSAPGGFVVQTTSTAIRSPLSPSDIASFLPSRGVFLFPAPYGTQGVRLTNDSDCPGNDCVLPVGYSYWKRINNHAGSDTLYAVLTLDRNRGGAGPTLFSYNKTTGVTTKVGPLFSSSDSLSWATGEMFYFSATRPTALYVHEGPRLMRYDVLARTTELVVDISAQFGSDKYIWQPNSSNDDRMHSFTVRRTGDWATLGCAVYDESTGGFAWFNASGGYDECQIDKSGRYLVIKDQVDGAQGEDNVIVDLATGLQRVLLDPDGAGGHSDLGFGYLVAEDNFNSLPGAVRLWRLDQDPHDPANGRLMFHVTQWNWGANHVTHGNAASGAPDQQMVCSSEVTRATMPLANEVLCYKLDGSLQVLVVAPVMTDLDASGGGDDYFKAPKGNLDVTGEFFIWTSNLGGARMDAFIVRVPKQLLGLSSGGSGGGTSPPAPNPNLPGGLNKLSPAYGSSAPMPPTIEWTPSSGATSYQYCVDTSNNSVCDTAWLSTSATSTVLGGLAANTSYSWQVRAVNAYGVTEADGGTSWTFSTSSSTTGADLLTNGSFSGGLTGWGGYAEPSLSYLSLDVQSGVLTFARLAGSSQAVVLQRTGTAVPGNTGLTARFDAGNSSTVRKRISVLLHDGDFSDLQVCTFWLAPQTPLRAYAMRTRTSHGWDDATISLYAATVGTDGGAYRVDNVSLRADAAVPAGLVDCIDPTAPGTSSGANSANLIDNGNFTMGLTGWGTFGQIATQTTGGVLQFYRPPGTPAGVVLQGSGDAMTSGQIITATFRLGNSSSVRKRATLLLHDADFSDLQPCTFWLPPGQPLGNYTMRMFTTRPWTNATVSFYPATIGTQESILVDDVVLRRTPGTAITGTQCAGPF